MRKIEWFKYRHGDLDGLKWSSSSKDTEANILPPAYTAFCDEKIIACAGIQPLWNGVGEAWIAVCEGAEEFIGLPGAVLELLDRVQEEHRFHRVQASVALSNQIAYRMDLWLGFEDEGIMSKYGPDGQDYYRLARIRKWD